MKSQLKAGKLFLVGTLVLLSGLLSHVAPVSADAGSTIVQNTNTCYAGKLVNVDLGSGPFTVVWNDDNTFTITAKQPLSEDTSLYASSYHLTSNLYQGGCFSRSASSGTWPQTYDGNTQVVTLPQGFVGTMTVTVVLPKVCYNEQVDLYQGGEDGSPLNGPVTQSGHDDYGYIAGNIMLTAKNPACNQPATPPVTPVIPQVLGASTSKPAAQLTNTGLPVAVTSVLGAGLMSGAIFVSRKKAPALEDISL